MRAITRSDERVPGWARLGRARAVTLNVLAIIGLICLLCVAVALVTGARLVTFVSGSMSPTIPTGSLALTLPVDGDEIAEGDIVSVERPEDGRLVTHRVVSVHRSGDRMSAILKGDANDQPDLLPYDVADGVQRVVIAVPVLGTVATALATPWALVALFALLMFVALPRGGPPRKQTHGPPAEHASTGGRGQVPAHGRRTDRRPDKRDAEDGQSLVSQRDHASQRGLGNQRDPADRRDSVDQQNLASPPDPAGQHDVAGQQDLVGGERTARPRAGEAAGSALGFDPGAPPGPRLFAPPPRFHHSGRWVLDLGERWQLTVAGRRWSTPWSPTSWPRGADRDDATEPRDSARLDHGEALPDSPVAAPLPSATVIADRSNAAPPAKLARSRVVPSASPDRSTPTERPATVTATSGPVHATSGPVRAASVQVRSTSAPVRAASVPVRATSTPAPRAVLPERRAPARRRRRTARPDPPSETTAPLPAIHTPDPPVHAPVSPSSTPALPTGTSARSAGTPDLPTGSPALPTGTSPLSTSTPVPRVDATTPPPDEMAPAASLRETDVTVSACSAVLAAPWPSRRSRRVAEIAGRAAADRRTQDVSTMVAHSADAVRTRPAHRAEVDYVDGDILFVAPQIIDGQPDPRPAMIPAPRRPLDDDPPRRRRKHLVAP